MAAKAKASSSPSCLSFLKDALLLPTQNVKLFLPVFLLITVPTFLLQVADHVLRTNQTNTTDPSSADYANLMKRFLKEESGSASAMIAISVTIAILVITITSAYGFAIQIVPLFAASTTYSGDRYSLPELLSKAITKGGRLRGPLVTYAMVCVLDFACMVPLTALFLPVVMTSLGPLYKAALSAFQNLAFRYLDVVFVVAVAASVADTKHRGVGAILLAWRLMTRVWRKQGFVLVVVHVVVAKFPSSPLHRASVAYWKKSMPMGLALLVVYTLLYGLIQLWLFAAATVYYYQAMKSMKKTEATTMAP